MEAAPDRGMRLFHLPGGLQVWNSPESETDTQFLYREIFQRRNYEQHGIEVGDGAVVFDVGANVGMFGLSLMERCTGLRLFCFEPVPGTYACLERNLGESTRRAAHEVVMLNMGLGRAEGEARVEFFPGAPSNSTLHSEEKHRDFARILDGVRFADLWRTNKLRALYLAPLFPFRKPLLGAAYERMLSQGVLFSCRIRPLSAIVQDHGVERIDLLKVDVEGAELDVLAGIDGRHWPLVQQIVMEVEPANKPRLGELVDQLRGHGFSQIVVQNMFGGPCRPDDAVGCNIYGTRARIAN
jgi:FkbM family methyltransferase